MVLEIVAEEIAAAAAGTVAEATAAVAAVLVAVIPPAAPRRISDRRAIAAPAFGGRWGGCTANGGGSRWSWLRP